MKPHTLLLAFTFLFSFAAQSSAQSVLPSIRKDIGETAVRNIEESERVFCYQVSSKAPNYRGYTINNMAVTGFCGIVDDNLKRLLLEQILANEDNIDFMSIENCTIKPRVLLRFVRGVDNTDVLLSSPCDSVTVFYAGKINTYNMKPAGELLKTTSDAFYSKQIPFVSPALLNQLLPIGVAQTQEQKATLSQAAQPQPKRSWDSQPSTSTSGSQSKWNSLKLSK